MARALDVHVHPSPIEFARSMGQFYAPMEQHYRADLHGRTEAEMIAELRAADVRCVLLALDEVNSRLQDKALFGSDYPFIPPERRLREFEAGGYKPAVIDKVLYQNAERLLGVSRNG